MKKIIFILLVLSLLILSGCVKEETSSSDGETFDEGYVSDLDTELDTSDLDAIDEDLNDLDWV